MFIKFTNRSSYHDPFFRKIDKKDKTWKSVLDAVEQELEGAYLNNEEEIIGIGFNIEIVDKLPKDIEWEED